MVIVMTIKVSHTNEHHAKNLDCASTVDGQPVRKRAGVLNSEPRSKKLVTEPQSPTLLRRDSYRSRGSFGFLVMKL